MTLGQKAMGQWKVCFSSVNAFLEGSYALVWHVGQEPSSALGSVSSSLNLGFSHYQLGDFEQIICPSMEIASSVCVVRTKRCHEGRKHVLNGNFYNHPPLLFLESLFAFLQSLSCPRYPSAP